MQELLNNYLPNVAQRLPDFGQALKETLVMVAWSGIICFILGLILGVLITVTKRGAILENSLVYQVLDKLISLFRSIPFIILLTWVMPVTRAIMGTTIHKKLGNVSVKLALAFLVGSICGTFIGGFINKSLYDYSPLVSDIFISTIYALLLGFLGFYALFDFLRATRGVKVESSSKKVSANAGMTGLSVKLQSLTVPPMITFDEDLVPGGRRISAWIIAFGGIFVGMLAAIMGVGGGFVTFPMFVYIFGVSSMTTVGTDILQIIFTAGLASVGQYAIYGYVFYTLAVGMLLGSLLGIQVGALTTKVVKGVHIRGFYAVSIISGFINRAATLPNDVAAAAGVVERPIHEAGAVQAVRLLCTGGVAALGCDLCRLAPAVVPAQHQRFAAPEVVHLVHQCQRVSDDHAPFHGEIVRQALPHLHSLAGRFHGVTVRDNTCRGQGRRNRNHRQGHQ